MFQHLRGREQGSLKRYERVGWKSKEVSLVNERLQSLQLADNKEIKCRQVTPINWLTIDKSENRYLLGGLGNGRISLYDTQMRINQTGFRRSPTAQKHWGKGHTSGVTCVQWYPFDTGLFVSSGADGFVNVWDTNELTVAQNFDFNEQIINACSLSPISTTHSLIAVAPEGPQARLCDMSSGAYSHTLIGHRGKIRSVAWSPRNEYQLVTGATDGGIRMWDIRRAGSLMIFDPHNHFNPHINSKYLNAEDQKTASRIKSHSGCITHLEFSPHGMHLVSTATDRKVRYWDALSGKNTLVNFGNTINSRRLNRFCLSPDGQYLYYPSASEIQVYELDTGKHIKTLQGHWSNINTLTMNVETLELFSGSDDNTILVWEPKPCPVVEESLSGQVLVAEGDDGSDQSDWGTSSDDDDDDNVSNDNHA